jgi:hypothetical protein
MSKQIILHKFNNSRIYTGSVAINNGGSMPPLCTYRAIPDNVDLSEFSLKFNGTSWDIVAKVPTSVQIERSANFSEKFAFGDLTVSNIPKNTKITKLAFLKRFLELERITLRTLAKTNPVIEDYMAIVDAAAFIDLSREDTQQFVRTLEASGLISTGRANTILDTKTILPIEEYKEF